MTFFKSNDKLIKEAEERKVLHSSLYGILTFNSLPVAFCGAVCLVRVQVSIKAGSGSSLQPDTQKISTRQQTNKNYTGGSIYHSQRRHQILKDEITINEADLFSTYQPQSYDTLSTEGLKARVENMDCRIGMKQLGENTVSLVLTDPPYFIDGMDEDWNTKKLTARMKGGVVGSLPAGMKFSVDQGRELQRFLTPIAEEWMRVIRPGGFCLVFSQNRLVHRAAIALEDAGFEIRDMLLWRYEGQAKAFTQDHFVRKRKLTVEEKERLIQKLGGRKTPQLKPQGEMIILGQAPREGTFVDNWDKWETGLIDVKDPLIGTTQFPGTGHSSKKAKRKVRTHDSKTR